MPPPSEVVQLGRVERLAAAICPESPIDQPAHLIGVLRLLHPHVVVMRHIEPRDNRRVLRPVPERERSA